MESSSPLSTFTLTMLRQSSQKNEDAAAGSSGDSDASREEGNQRRVNLDITQLEMLRDILTYKA